MVCEQIENYYDKCPPLYHDMFNVYLKICVWSAGADNYIRQYLWDVITYP